MVDLTDERGSSESRHLNLLPRYLPCDPQACLDFLLAAPLCSVICFSLPSPPLPSALLSFSLLSPFPPLPVLVSSGDEDLSLCGAFWGKVPDDNGIVLELVPPGVVSVSLNPLPQHLLWGLA